jgi:hypothetical protein
MERPGLTGTRIDVHDDSHGSGTQDVVWQIRGDGLRDAGIGMARLGMEQQCVY